MATATVCIILSQYGDTAHWIAQGVACYSKPRFPTNSGLPKQLRLLRFVPPAERSGQSYGHEVTQQESSENSRKSKDNPAIVFGNLIASALQISHSPGRVYGRDGIIQFGAEADFDAGASG